jgi:hypothetical protein
VTYFLWFNLYTLTPLEIQFLKMNESGEAQIILGQKLIYNFNINCIWNGRKYIYLLTQISVQMFLVLLGSH